MILEIIKELHKLTVEKKEEEKYRAQLMKMPLNFEALEHLAAKYRDRKITVQLEGNTTITIEPKSNDSKYKSFKDSFFEARNGD